MQAGTTYDCAMQWGAAAFPATAITVMQLSLFVATNNRVTIQQTMPILRRGPGVAHLASVTLDDTNRLHALWDSWLHEHEVTPLS